MSQSSQLFEHATQHIPGGVNSPVRSFRGVGGNPLFFKQGKGAYITDIDGNSYVDYVGSWGPLIVGHAHPAIIEAVQNTIANGLSFGAPCPQEVMLADKICEIMPNIEMVRMVNSGTEAAMSAIRLARGYTKRNKILKFNGCYHGHCDALLVKGGSGLLTLGTPDSAGVPEDFVRHTLVAEFNDLDSVTQLFEKYGNDIAAIIVEPVAANMNCVLPEEGFLKGLREICDAYQSVLIFDEVITGFRVVLGGAQAYYDIKPDLTVLGKIIGGGMPVGAFGGRKEIMACIAPLGPVYQAGTLSGNPIAMTAGLETLRLISQPNFHKKLAITTESLTKVFNELANTYQVPFTTNYVGSLFGIFFTNEKMIRSFNDVSKGHLEQFKKFYHLMLEQGIYLAPSMYEAGFISSAHGQDELEKTFNAAEHAFRTLAKT